uniref:hypothetical protein n=1 Tax=Dyella soli TaxID=522319 RepID=UPI0013F3FF48|nr:hypothetical protein [Dyella soli]
MTGAMKVVGGFVLLIVFVVAAEVLPQWYALHLVEKAASDPDPLGWQAQARAKQADNERQASANARLAYERAARQRDRLALRASEQCIGGTVVEVNGSTYVQVLGSDGRPEACEGRMRLHEPSTWRPHGA